MAGAKNHEYHILPPSPWPLMGAAAALALFGGTVMWLHNYGPGPWVIALGVLGVFATMIFWWKQAPDSKMGAFLPGSSTPINSV